MEHANFIRGVLFAARAVPDLVLFLKKALHERKASSLQFQFQYISTVLNLTYNKNKLYETLDIDPEICSILIFQKRNWEQFLHHILCINFQEKYFSCCILLTDQISLSDCLFFLRYWSICVLQLFVNQVVKFPQ